MAPRKKSQKKSQKKVWVFTPPKPVKPQVPDSLKRLVQEQADDLIENILKPKHVKPAEPGKLFNHPVDIYSKWYRSYFYFCAKHDYAYPDPINPSFETRFARMEYVEADLFTISYMRHTGKWYELYEKLPLSECLRLIAEGHHFFIS
ncbi:DUF3024 domain-containing protein [Prochlorothrix hollandica]|uniref:Uncharacterized protein n=1 Tax=Prochlorothrix hollandica PCC 9006 = CALU 1027 TaxID=317619 RepID=A0A0M2PY22_PROHO|nr:hypothetical protein [Prochlorothrix hollandica]KKJ01311.1 hypothetical protein PROH_02820 [Prochlorothrix hollandica PCC 9006 = CALU 1027]